MRDNLSIFIIKAIGLSLAYVMLTASAVSIAIRFTK